jgi:hypothetical protein
LSLICLEISAGFENTSFGIGYGIHWWGGGSPQTGASVDGDGERRAYMGRMWLVAWVRSGGRLLEALMVATGEAMAAETLA